MKKFFFALAFVAIAMFAFNNTATASTTINFYLQINDGNNCPGGPSWTGAYYVRITIIVNGNEVCFHDQYNSSSAATQVTWVCNATLTQYDKITVKFDICHYDANSTPQLTCCQSVYDGTLNMDELTNGSYSNPIQENYNY